MSTGLLFLFVQHLFLFFKVNFFKNLRKKLWATLKAIIAVELAKIHLKINGWESGEIIDKKKSNFDI